MLKRRAVDGDGEICLAESASLGGGAPVQAARAKSC
jgi:hypothetical protein